MTTTSLATGVAAVSWAETELATGSVRIGPRRSAMARATSGMNRRGVRDVLTFMAAMIV
jgi:hypothetical protein